MAYLRLIFAVAILFVSVQFFGLTDSKNVQSLLLKNGNGTTAAPTTAHTTPHTGNGTTVPEPHVINGTCKSETDCGQNTFCNSASKCECLYDFVPSDKGSPDCVPTGCKTAAECNTFFVAHNQCVKGHCVCADGYQLNVNTQLCEAQSKKKLWLIIGIVVGVVVFLVVLAALIFLFMRRR